MLQPQAPCTCSAIHITACSFMQLNPLQPRPTHLQYSLLLPNVARQRWRGCRQLAADDLNPVKSHPYKHTLLHSSPHLPLPGIQRETSSRFPNRENYKPSSDLAPSLTGIPSMKALSARTGDSVRNFFLSFCNSLEILISHMHSDSLHDPQLLQGNFAPVSDECASISCSSNTPLPPFLNGVYVRNGPNQQFKASAAKLHSNHLFDGDGMLHCVSFHGGRKLPTYCCRYVHTSRFLQERGAGQALFPKIFSTLTVQERFIATAYTSLAVLRHMLGLVDLTRGMGLANTGLAFHHGKLLALGEDDVPYALHIQANGDLANTGRYKFKGNVNMPRSMASHPKVDKQTGEMIFLSSNIFFRPHLTLFRMSPDGTLTSGVPISLHEPCMIHDFAITSHFIIFPETQLVFHPLHMLQGKPPIKYDAQKVQRFGVLPRNATDDSEFRWFEVPGCNCFHILNAWEEYFKPESAPKSTTLSQRPSSSDRNEVQEIVVIFPHLSSPNDLVSGDFNKVEGTLTEVRLDMANAKAPQSPLLVHHQESNKANVMNVEMGTMNELYRGVKNRYLYMGILRSSSHSLSGLAKVDLETRTVVGRRTFDENYYASEPMFVSTTSSTLPPHTSIHLQNATKEDEACILCFLHHEETHDHPRPGAANSNTCAVLVLDAQSPTLDVIATIEIPRRVPYGFHSLFIPRNTQG